ncbi:MAG: carbamoyltransferase HypF [Candidatus Bathyarchaeia archaeon]
MHAIIIVTGIVQGVGFRPFIYRIAKRQELRGFVRNRADAVVEISVEGEKSRIDAFLHSLREEKPPLARLDSVQVEYPETELGLADFTIEKSSQERTKSGSVIPPDIAICDDCLKELRSPGDRRHRYFFITCTNCGPRYTTIVGVPYDRPNTTLNQFPMCPKCRVEYTNPGDRRFHAQTIACPICGPKVTLLNNSGNPMDVVEPIREAGRLLSEGKTLALKGNGGFHLAASTLQDDPIERLRRSKERRSKPFAIMARSLDSILAFAEVRSCERELLESYVRPIVLLRRKEPFPLSSLISPGLDTVGVMLPYTGMHYLIFDSTSDPALIMTSANAPNEPIITDNRKAIQRLGTVVDYFLVHDREIAQRADDSVIRFIGDEPTPIRRSRGYAPVPIVLSNPSKMRALAFGAELNVTACMTLDNKAYLTQHIGDTETVETAKFLEAAVAHLGRLIGFEPETIACDLHPKFTTTKIAERMSKEHNVPLRRIQHHHAHAGSLMAEHSLDAIVGIVCDGFGLGYKNEAWGGEIFVCHASQVRRAAHLEEQPMVGADLATRYPARMAAGILRDEPTIQAWLKANASHLPHGESEIPIVMRQLDRKDFIWTSSCGRVLDSIAAILGISYERTYEGEPAMKLEAYSRGGADRLNIKPEIDGEVIKTTNMVHNIYDQKTKIALPDLAFSAHAYLGRALANAAITIAEEEGIKVVGFSGGVALNEIISLTIRKLVSDAGFRYVSNVAVPPGDGGVSFGQAYLASLQ